jgi:hypothetical protein
MDLSDQIRNFLGDISLQDLMRRREIKEISETQDSRLTAHIEQESVPLTLVADAQ